MHIFLHLSHAQLTTSSLDHGLIDLSDLTAWTLCFASGLGSLLQVPIGGPDHKSTSDMAEKIMQHVWSISMSRDVKRIWLASIAENYARWQCRSWCWSSLVSTLESIQIHSGHRIQSAKCVLLQAALVCSEGFALREKTRLSRAFTMVFKCDWTLSPKAHTTCIYLYNQYCRWPKLLKKGSEKQPISQ